MGVVGCGFWGVWGFRVLSLDLPPALLALVASAGCGSGRDWQVSCGLGLAGQGYARAWLAVEDQSEAIHLKS